MTGPNSDGGPKSSIGIGSSFGPKGIPPPGRLALALLQGLGLVLFLALRQFTQPWSGTNRLMTAITKS